jgi:vacuolar-type H+-ATPase subunit H
MQLAKEAEILKEIRTSEDESEDMLKKAEAEKQRIIEKAKKDSLKAISDKKGEIVREQEEKLAALREKAASLRNEKLQESKKSVMQLKAKSQKNISKAVDFVMEKFEDMI